MEEKTIERLLKSITAQSYSNQEIIVIDNNSTDNTVILAKKYTKKVFTKGPERSAQRNYGAKMANGDFLFFLDADMKLSAHVVKDCVAAIQKDKKIGALTIAEESVVTNFWEKTKGFERSFYNESGDRSTDAARFFSRKCFENLIGYDESITGPEDWDITNRVEQKGYSIHWIKTPIYHYENVPSPFSLAKKKYYYGLRAHRYMKKHNVSAVSAQTIYFLRPVFYKQWRKLVSHPLLTVSMFFMLFIELAAGGLGYLRGAVTKI